MMIGVGCNPPGDEGQEVNWNDLGAGLAPASPMTFWCFVMIPPQRDRWKSWGV